MKNIESKLIINATQSESAEGMKYISDTEKLVKAPNNTPTNTCRKCYSMFVPGYAQNGYLLFAFSVLGRTAAEVLAKHPGEIQCV